MKPIDRILAWFARRRGFVLGPGVVEFGDSAFGREKPYQPTANGDYLATSGAVYSCITLRQDLLASLPLKAYRVNSLGERREVRSGAIVDLLKKVNPYWTTQRLIAMSEQTLGLWGESFWFLDRGASEIWWGRPDRVSVLADEVDYVRGYLYEPLNGGADIPFTPDETVWIRYPNALDEYAGLAPLNAVKNAADYGIKGMRANVNLFDNGWQMGGVVMPTADGPMRELTEEQAKELTGYFDRRLKGRDKAHRWAVLRHAYQVQPMDGVTPREAEFLAGLAFSLEEIARAYRIPLDLIGGQRTYENVDAAMRAVWMHAILPEATFLGTELTEQLLPKFPGEADIIAFDTSGVAALQEAEDAKWAREQQMLAEAAMTVNEWRRGRQLAALPWGDLPADYEARARAVANLVAEGFDPTAALAVFGLPNIPIAPRPEPAPALPPPLPPAEDAPALPEGAERAVRAVRQRQRAAVAARVRNGEAEPYEHARWHKAYREALRAAGLPEREAQRVSADLNMQAAQMVREAVAAGRDVREVLG